MTGWSETFCFNVAFSLFFADFVFLGIFVFFSFFSSEGSDIDPLFLRGEDNLILVRGEDSEEDEEEEELEEEEREEAGKRFEDGTGGGKIFFFLSVRHRPFKFEI